MSRYSNWDTFNIEDRVKGILDDLNHGYHHNSEVLQPILDEVNKVAILLQAQIILYNEAEREDDNR